MVSLAFCAGSSSTTASWREYSLLEMIIFSLGMNRLFPERRSVDQLLNFWATNDVTVNTKNCPTWGAQNQPGGIMSDRAWEASFA